MVFSPLTPETLPGRGLAVVALHLPLQHIRERGVQWGGVMGLCYCGTIVAVPLLRFHCCGFTVAVSPLPRLRLGEASSRSLYVFRPHQSNEALFGPRPSCLLTAYSGAGRAVGRSNGAMLLLHHRYGSSVAASPFP